MSNHDLIPFSLSRDPNYAFVVMIPQTDRWMIIGINKCIEDEEGYHLDFFKTRHKDTSLQS
jgi:hypothetical protein